MLVQRADRLQLAGLQVKVGDLQVLRQAGGVVALGDNGNVTLSSPAQQDLSRGAVVLGGNGGDGSVLEQLGGILGVLELELDEAERAEGRVGGDGDALLLGVVDQRLLGEVGVVLDLEGGRADAGVAEQVHQQLGAEVADADAASQLLVDQRLHGGPGLLDGGLAELDLALGVLPAGRVAHTGVDVLESDGEVHNVQVEVVDAQVGQLLAGDGLDPVAVVEAVPQLGDEEEVLARDDALLDGASDTLADLDLVAVVWNEQISKAARSRELGVCVRARESEYLPQAPSNRR